MRRSTIIFAKSRFPGGPSIKDWSAPLSKSRDIDSGGEEYLARETLQRTTVATKAATAGRMRGSRASGTRGTRSPTPADLKQRVSAQRRKLRRIDAVTTVCGVCVSPPIGSQAEHLRENRRPPLPKTQPNASRISEGGITCPGARDVLPQRSRNIRDSLRVIDGRVALQFPAFHVPFPLLASLSARRCIRIWNI